MKMKNMLIGGMSLALVACISVGATLAYLTAKTDTMTNTFTVGAGYGNNVLTLDETKVIVKDGVKENPTAIGGEGERTSVDQTYAPINIGDQFVKDPTFHVAKNSASSYVFAKVTGMDELVAKKFIVGNKGADGKLTVGIDKNVWERVADENGDPVQTSDKNYDGYYIYKGTKSTDGVIATSTNNIDLEALFTYIELPATVESMPDMTSNNTIDVAGAIIQSENLDKSTALDEVLKIEGFGTVASAEG